MPLLPWQTRVLTTALELPVETLNHVPEGELAEVGPRG
jgi:hypothetical protein